MSNDGKDIERLYQALVASGASGVSYHKGETPWGDTVTFAKCDVPKLLQAPLRNRLMNHCNTPAGPELDSLIAERVMGWTSKDDHWYGDGADDIGSAGNEDGFPALRVSKGPYRAYWHPSTNIAHAWEVVQRMKEDHDFNISNNQGEVMEWIVEIERLDAQAKASAEGETAPEAICRAALSVVSH